MSLRPTPGGSRESDQYFLVTQVWWSATAMTVFYFVWRYYFYGQIQAKLLDSKSNEDWEELAKVNKRYEPLI